MPIRTPDGYLDITNATLRASEITTTSKVGIANSTPTHTLSVGNKLFVDDNASNVLTVSGNLVATSLKLGHIDLTPSYGLEHVANVINTISNVVQFTNTTTGFVSVSNVGIGTSTSPAGLLDVVGAFRMRYQDMGLTKVHIISGANTTSLNEDAGTYTYTRGAATTTGYFLPNPTNITPKVGQRYRVKLTARSDYAGTIRYECPTSTIITTYDLTTSFKEYTWDFNAGGTTMQFAVTTPLGSTTQFNAFSIERLGVGFNVNPTSTTAPLEISGVTHFSDNVGIGTASPATGLHVRNLGGADVPSSIIIQPASTSYARGYAKIEAYPDATHGAGTGLRFYTREDSGSDFAVDSLVYERMTIKNNGFVGIGTVSPTSMLELAANGGGSIITLKRTNTSNGGSKGGIRFTENTNGYNVGTIACLGDGANTSGALCFYTKASSTDTGIYLPTTDERMRISSSGNVGIGTNGPKTKLHINSTGPNYTGVSGNDRFRISEYVTSNGNEFGLQIGHNQGTGNTSLQSYYYTASNGAYTNGYSILLQPYGGWVGIGTGVVGETLHVHENLSTSGHQICARIGGSGSSSYNTLVFGSKDGRPHIGGHRADYGAWYDMSLQNDLMILNQSNMRVGINETAPEDVLDVRNGTGSNEVSVQVRSGGLFVRRHNGTPHYPLIQTDFGMTRPRLMMSDTTGTTRVFISGDANDKTYFNAGHVGIGTATPYARLHVYGSGGSMSSASRVYFAKNDYIGGGGGAGYLIANSGGWSPMGIYATDTILTNQYFVSHSGSISSSDERIKKNIVDADDAECLETLRLLKPKKYQYRDVIDRGEEPVWGFIAQEVRDTLPYATQLRKDVLPNIYELANVSSSNVITFTNFNTSDLESNATTLIRTKGIDGEDHDIHLAEVIDTHTIRVEEDLTMWTGSVDAEGNVISEITTTTVTPEEYEALEDKTGFNKNDDDTYTKTNTIYPGNQLFVYGQEVDDFVFLKKESIFTVATAALQEVDRQLQAEKTKTSTFETELQAEKSKTSTLETKTSTFETELQAEKTKTTALETKLQTETAALETKLQTETAALETKTTTLETELQAEKVKTTALETKLQEAEDKIATLQAEKGAIRSDLSSLVLRVVALES